MKHNLYLCGNIIIYHVVGMQQYIMHQYIKRIVIQRLQFVSCSCTIYTAEGAIAYNNENTRDVTVRQLCKHTLKQI